MTYLFRDWRSEDEADIALPPVPEQSLLPETPAGVRTVLAPRGYQQTAHDQVWAAFEEVTSTILIAATGVGKTTVAAMVIETALAKGWEVLFLAHRDELIRQAATEFRERLGVPVGVDAAESYAPVGPDAPRVTVASKDTIWRPWRLQRHGQDRFQLLIADECHHVSGADNKTYWNIVRYFRQAKRLGLTATADRTDRKAMNRSFESVAYAYDVLDAVTDGWLVRPVQKLVTVDGYDLSRVRSGRDLNEADLADIIRREGVMQQICAAAATYSNWSNGYPSRRPTLVFAPSAGTAKEMADVLNRRHARDGTGAAAAIVHEGADPATRRGLIERYRRGDIQYLCSYGVLLEGFNAPETRCVVLARATKSRLVYAQAVGRVLRPHPAVLAALAVAPDAAARQACHLAGPKPSGLIIDLVGVSGAHKLVTAQDYLGGKYPLGVVERAKAVARDRPEGKAEDVIEGLKAARVELELAAKARKASVVVDYKLLARLVDPFEILDVATLCEPGLFTGKKATEGQKACLVKAGFKDREAEAFSYSQACVIIDRIVERSKQGLATLKQARLLKKYGYDPDLPFAEARRLLDRLSANGWRPLSGPHHARRRDPAAARRPP